MRLPCIDGAWRQRVSKEHGDAVSLAGGSLGDRECHPQRERSAAERTLLHISFSLPRIESIQHLTIYQFKSHNGSDGTSVATAERRDERTLYNNLFSTSLEV